MENGQFTSTLAETGKLLREIIDADGQKPPPGHFSDPVCQLFELTNEAKLLNPWFIPQFVRHALKAWSEALVEEKIVKWLSAYSPGKPRDRKPSVIGLVMAGNLPMVGLHDLLCVLASGNHALVKLSRQDDRLIPALLEIISGIQPELKDRVRFTVGTLSGVDAVIATGSNNTSRYFDYYFGKYPHIIRKNRNGVAVIRGDESEDWYRGLADDIFLYFGLGCRNVSKIYLPEGFNPTSLFDYVSGYAFVGDHHKFANNYDYQKSILLINRLEFFDNGYMILKPDDAISSPVSVVHYEYYTRREKLYEQLKYMSALIQCVVVDDQGLEGAVPAGKTQNPELWEYADAIDTMEFLLSL